MHHGELGGLIAQHWELPPRVVQGIIHHHEPNEDNDAVCYFVCVANQVAKRIEAKMCIRDRAWVAPGGFQMEVEGTADDARLRLHQGPPENYCRPAVDVLFRSAAKVFGSRVLAVMLTGMGQDGLIGSQWIREAGGKIIVQDEASSVVWGMPGAVFNAGLAEMVLPLREIAAEINRRVFSGTPRSHAIPLALEFRAPAKMP